MQVYPSAHAAESHDTWPGAGPHASTGHAPQYAHQSDAGPAATAAGTAAAVLETCPPGMFTFTLPHRPVFRINTECTDWGFTDVVSQCVLSL